MSLEAKIEELTRALQTTNALLARLVEGGKLTLSPENVSWNKTVSEGLPQVQQQLQDIKQEAKIQQLQQVDIKQEAKALGINPNAPGKITKEQYEAIKAKASELVLLCNGDNTIIKPLLAPFGVRNLSELPASGFNRCLELLEAQIQLKKSST